MLLAPGTPPILAHRARAGLRATFGAEAVVTGRAPGRVNLIGEHTDYNAGLVLPIALPHATYVAVAPRSDSVLRIASRQEEGLFVGSVPALEPGSVTGWAAYAAGVVWALREQGIELPGMDLYVDSTVPVGAGLSSSAAIECATAIAVLRLAGVVVTDAVREDTVTACVEAETRMAGAPTGGMDQTVALFAREGEALLIDFAHHARTPVPLVLGDRTVLVTDTRVKHTLADGGYGSRRDDCTEAAGRLGVETLRAATAEQVESLDDDRLRRRARHVVTEIARVPAVFAALRSQDWAGVGRTFAASHASMRDDFEISTPELDLAVETALEAGADGARMTGGGFGGSIVALVPEARVGAVTAAIDAAFAAKGLPEPQHLVATPSEGAGLVP
jgi:galactokinase